MKWLVFFWMQIIRQLKVITNLSDNVYRTKFIGVLNYFKPFSGQSLAICFFHAFCFWFPFDLTKLRGRLLVKNGREVSKTNMEFHEKTQVFGDLNLFVFYKISFFFGSPGVCSKIVGLVSAS